MKLLFSIFASVICCALFAVSKGGESIHLFRSDFQDKSFITISYTNPFQMNGQGKDLKEYWKQYLFSSLLQQRLQQSLAQEGIQCSFHPSTVQHPNAAYTISVSCASSQVVEALATLNQHSEQIKKSGFSERELRIAKEKAYLGLFKLEDQHSGEMACLISNQISNEGAQPNLNVLIETSKDLIEMVSLSEVSEFSRAQMIDANREISVVVPNEESFISENELRQILEEQKWVAENQMSGVGTHALAKAVIGNPQCPLIEEEMSEEVQPQFEEIPVQLVASGTPVAMQPSEPMPVITEENVAKIEEIVDYYSQLQINGEEKKIISKIIITVAENNVLKLLFEKKKLEKLGKRINHLHPLKFLGTILSDQRLHHCLREIRRSSFKWDEFMGGFVRRMNEELGHDNVKKYVPSFSSFFQANTAQLMTYIDRRDFEGMVLSLL